MWGTIAGRGGYVGDERDVFRLVSVSFDRLDRNDRFIGSAQSDYYLASLGAIISIKDGVGQLGGHTCF